MRSNKFKITLFSVLSLILIAVAVSIPYSYLQMFDDNMYLSKQEFASLTSKVNTAIFNTEILKVSATDPAKEKELNQYSVKFKLFNLINIKNLKVTINDDDLVYEGGNAIGISLKSKGVIIVGSNYIITKSGNVNPFNQSGLQIGDVITHMNGKEINTLEDVARLIDTNRSQNPIDLNILRKSHPMEIKINPALDIQTNTYKLGLWVRDDAQGVGTLTFVKKKDNRFGSLGHAIIDADTGTVFNVDSGEVYKSNIVGVKQGRKGAPGELLGLFMQGENNFIGSVDKNTNNGVYGFVTNDAFLSDKGLYEVGGRLTAKPGRAKILSCVNGTEIKEYDIEIIKTNYQTKANEKSMVLKITDEELLSKTGGIVQGMSGSPIIQDGKIIGAVTHVFINDPTKGFGLYIDWMLQE